VVLGDSAKVLALELDSYASRKAHELVFNL